MMNDTKEIKEYYQRKVKASLNDVLARIEKDGFTPDTYCYLRFLQDDLSCLNASEHFYGAWHPEAKEEKRQGA